MQKTNNNQLHIKMYFNQLNALSSSFFCELVSKHIVLCTPFAVWQIIKRFKFVFPFLLITLIGLIAHRAIMAHILLENLDL